MNKRRLVRVADSKTDWTIKELKKMETVDVLDIARNLGLGWADRVCENDDYNLDNIINNIVDDAVSSVREAFYLGLQAENFNESDEWIFVDKDNTISTTNNAEQYIDYYELANEIVDTPECANFIPEHMAEYLFSNDEV